MTTLARWNPFKSPTRFDPMGNFDEMFRGLAARSPWRDLDVMPSDMRLDVTEDDKAFHVKAEMPGIDKDDIDITVDGNQVTISGEMKREKTSKEDEKEIYSERYFGRIYRSFTLPGDFDGDKAKADLDGGVLSLSLPKKANGSTRRIAVS